LGCDYFPIITGTKQPEMRDQISVQGSLSPSTVYNRKNTGGATNLPKDPEPGRFLI
jgi:hypothetical protein